jgi:hypothetical protein
MFHLFRRDDHGRDEVSEASRRNDAAYDELIEALHRLLAERNEPGRTRKEHEQ